MGKLCIFVILTYIALAKAKAMSKEVTAASPPHCTQITKDTDYQSNYKFDYPAAYLIPGQKEAFQPLHCISPPTVRKAVTVVCDWAAPPMVQFTMGDEYVHVIRQDPSGRFLGNAVITTYQLCNHSLPPHKENDIDTPRVSPINA